MDKVLKLKSIASALERAGFNQARLAKELDISREAVSKWLSGRSFPKPNKLLKLALLLDLSFEDLVERTPSVREPVVAFRKKGSRKTTDLHIARAKDMGRMLSALVPYLPYDELVKPATLKQPVTEYSYLHKVAKKVREDIGISYDAVLDSRHLIKKFNDLQAVVIPVLWGDKSKHENALHIHLPDSMTTWVYLNLDSKAHDFKFWMAHELGHVHAPTLEGDEAEDFADAFAGALLFPQENAEKAYSQVRSKRSKAGKIKAIIAYAEEFIISPITIYNQLNLFAEHQGLPRVDLNPAIFAATTNFNKQYMTVSEGLFDGMELTTANYIKVAKNLFQSPFFESLKCYLVENNKSQGFIQTILDVSFLDAKGIQTELS